VRRAATVLDDSGARLAPESVVGALQPDDLFALRYIRDARLSPDGQRVAYGVSSTDQETESFEIWIAELTGGEAVRLPHFGNATFPRWSPDGRSLAFVGDGRLYVKSTVCASPAEALTPEHLSVQGAPSWSPDCSRLVVSLLERRPVTGTRCITGSHFRAEGIGFIDDLTQQLYVVARSGGSLHTITGVAEGMCSQPEWSPCGRRILFLASNDSVPGASYSPRLMTAHVDDGTVRTVLGGQWYITAARWLPSGERIAVAGAYDSDLTIPNPSLWMVDLDGAAQQRMPGLVGKLSGMMHHDMPAWELTRDNVITVADQSTALVTILCRGSMEIWRVALEGENSMERILAGGRSCIVLDANAAADTLLYAVTTLHSPTELCRAGLDGKHETRLTSLNDLVLARWPAMRIEPFEFVTGDGFRIDAWFMARSEYSGPLPTVLFIHGGPYAATGHAFRYDFHLLASHGFGVLFANFRGSAGYGDEFTRAIMGDWGGRGFPDHMGTVEAAIARGLADPERLGVWGPSHGGFATYWIVGHTDRFRAAVAEAGTTNLATSYYLTDAPETRARDLGGRPHEIPDVYRARSPITYAHHCTTPTMLIHGENDLRCPISEAEQFYRVLCDVGCKAELVRVPDCHHMGDSSGPLSARRAQNEALLRWFRRYL
jgi:dipeptidyl aminopeptidase/acylaminoacyl peptidase